MRFIFKDQQGDILVDRVENIEPYALLGDNPTGDYTSFAPASGSYELTMIPFTENNAGGDEGTALVLNFTVINGTSGRSAELSSYGDEPNQLFEGQVDVINVSPNPLINNELSIQFSESLDSEVAYRVYDASGKVLMTGSKEVVGEWMKIQFYNGRLPKNTYFLQLLGEEIKPTSVQFVKQ